MEYITAAGTEYKCRNVTTGMESIMFTVEGRDIAEIEKNFKKITKLSVVGDDKITYGVYEDLEFVSATVYNDGSISVMMHIPTEMEKRLKHLETSQNEQDEVIADLIGGKI